VRASPAMATAARLSTTAAAAVTALQKAKEKAGSGTEGAERSRACACFN